MAFIDTDSEDSTKESNFYNLNAAVGFGCKNIEEDVKVVQFFLKRLYKTPGFIKDKPQGEIDVDGKCGPQTRKWIWHTQTIVRNRGKSISVDGVCDKAGNPNNADNRYGSVSNTMYMIRALNGSLRKNDAEVYKNLTTHPDVPPDMRVLFLQIQAQGPAMIYVN